MKKILVAVAMMAFAATTYAGIAGSAHDIKANTTFRIDNQKSSCNYCHVPHFSQTWATGVPLWATSSPSGSFTTYTTATNTLDARGVLTCLACHGDGATATTGMAVAMTASNSAAFVGRSLTDDHPVGSAYRFTPGAAKYQSGIVLGNVTYTDGTSYEMTCSVCHDPHSTTNLVQPHLVRAPNGSTTGDFCLECHNK